MTAMRDVVNVITSLMNPSSLEKFFGSLGADDVLWVHF